MFGIDVPECHGPWKLVSTDQPVASLSRSVVECPECGERRVLTCTSIRAREGHDVQLEVVA